VDLKEQDSVQNRACRLWCLVTLLGETILEENYAETQEQKECAVRERTGTHSISDSSVKKCMYKGNVQTQSLIHL
jgi:hypothetical protein